MSDFIQLQNAIMLKTGSKAILNESKKQMIFESMCLNDDLKRSFERGIQFPAIIIFFDIHSFSKKVSKLKAEQIREYLEPYYDSSLSIILKYNGAVEKVMGDGIIVVFSQILNEITYADNMTNSILCLMEIIEKFHNKPKYKTKGAIHFSKPFFCKIGNEEFYKEYTVIGNGLTYCYRLEGIIDSPNQLVCLNSQFQKYFKNAIGNNKWKTFSQKNSLKGIGTDVDIAVCNYINPLEKLKILIR